MQCAAGLRLLRLSDAQWQAAIPRGPHGINPDTLRIREQLLSRPPTTRADAHVSTATAYELRWYSCQWAGGDLRHCRDRVW